MTALTIDDLIVKRPQNQRFWVVRASGGLFTETFRAANLMAIGHIDKLDLREGPVTAGDLKNLRERLEFVFPKRKRMSVTSHVNQTQKFCSEIKSGDLIVTVDSAHMMIGKVNGDPYIGKQPVVVEHAFRQSIKMEHQLRREVIWGPKLSRSSVPVALEMTLQAHQTVFSLDSHWQAVYHLLYPCFAYEGQLYLSANIRQRKALSNYSLSQFFAILSGIEAIAKTLSEGKAKKDLQYADLFARFVQVNQLTLTSKAEFMSPGTIWSKVKMTPTQMVVAAMIYVMLFGGDMTVLKTDGLIDKELRHQIFNMVTDVINDHRFNQLREDLKLETPQLDTAPLDGKKRIPQKIVV